MRVYGLPMAIGGSWYRAVIPFGRLEIQRNQKGEGFNVKEIPDNEPDMVVFKAQNGHVTGQSVLQATVAKFHRQKKSLTDDDIRSARFLLLYEKNGGYDDD